MRGVAVTTPSTATVSLAKEVAEEGGEEREDDVGAEVWPLVGRGVPHILLRRNVAVSGEAIDEVSSIDVGSVGQPSSMPSSPATKTIPPADTGGVGTYSCGGVWIHIGALGVCPS